MATDAAAIAPDARARKLRRGPLTRKQILDAALTLFSERGTARSSVRDIAQIAGITDAAIYYHFPSKRELFEALIEERGFTAALQSLETVDISETEAIAPGDAIRSIAEGALELMYANRGFMKVLMVEAMAEDPVAAEEYRMLVERWEKAEARILNVYAARGILRTTEVDALAKQLVVTVIGAFADYLMSPVTTTSLEPTPPPELMRHVRAAMRHIVEGVT